MKKLVLLFAAAIVVVAATPATSQTYTALYNFTVSGGYGYPQVLAQARDGRLYGTMLLADVQARGAVFDFQPTTSTFTPAHIFYKQGKAGYFPLSGFTLGTDGGLYGDTELGAGENGCGSLFRFTPGSSITGIYVLGNQGTHSPCNPSAPPIQGADGNFYGAAGSGPGIGYRITPTGVFTNLVTIPGGGSGGPLVQATDGNFYGMNGGNGNQVGTVFRMTPQGVLTTIHFFSGTDGATPLGALIQGSDGNLYGTASEGGTYGLGVIFKMTLNGTLTVLHNFGDPNYPNDGQSPVTAPLQATDGNFYGVTPGGGTTGFGGTLFQITPAGVYSILYNFDFAGGVAPYSQPMQDTDGKIYGTTSAGGTLNCGVIYSFDMGLSPFVKPVLPIGKIGKASGMLGQGFTGTTSVSFNGTPASFTVVSDTYLTASVPPGAITGFITVVTPSGTLTSNVPFHVLP